MSKTNRISVLALRRATSGLKEPLDPKLRRRIEALVENPTQDTWNAAYSIILHGDRFTTLWQAVLAVDPSFTSSKRSGQPWPRIPSRDTILEAINQAVAGKVAA